MRSALRAKKSVLQIICITLWATASHLMHAAPNHYLVNSSPRLEGSCLNFQAFPTLGYDSLLADFVWLEFVQFIGRNSPSQPDFVPTTASYLDEIVNLDPSFVQAYYFAAIILGGDCKRADLASDLINVGLQRMPNDWRLPYIAGVNQFLYAHNSGAAAKYYLQGSLLPGAPNWLERQSAILSADLPEIIKRINVWDRFYAEAANDHVRQIAKANLCTLWYQVYREAPTKVIRDRAVMQLRRFGLAVTSTPANR